MSKNYGLKIPVRVRIYARMYARAYDCQDSTTTREEHTPTEHDHRKGSNHEQHEKT